MCEEYPYDHFPEDNRELDNSDFEPDCYDYEDYGDEGQFDEDFDGFPEEDDWEDEEEAMIMNGG